MYDDILSAEYVYSDEEIYIIFQERCETAKLVAGEIPAELKEATKALARMLDRNSNLMGRC